MSARAVFTRRFAGAILLALAALALAGGGCAKKGVTPPAVGVGPRMTAVSPLPRQLQVASDAPIWAQFDQALDPGSVDSTTVFLKQDTQRLPIDIFWEKLTRRVILVPRASLALSKTYTVVLSPHLRSPSGAEVGATTTWQFTTNSLFKIHNDKPAQGALEGPHVFLSWSGNAAATNPVQYDVYASVDSAAVFLRSIAPLVRTSSVLWLPRNAWPSGATVYWAVTAINTVTGERLNGPTGRFDVLPAGTPVDTLVIPFQDYGSVSSSNIRQQYCSAATFPVGPIYNAGIRFALTGDQQLSVENAWLTLRTTANVGGDLAVFAAQTSWAPCGLTSPGPPFVDTGGLLASAEALGPLGGDATFRAPGLAAFVEAATRQPGFFGFLLRSTTNYSVYANTAGQPTPMLRVTYYRTGPVPARAVRR